MSYYVQRTSKGYIVIDTVKHRPATGRSWSKRLRAESEAREMEQARQEREAYIRANQTN